MGDVCDKIWNGNIKNDFIFLEDVIDNKKSGQYHRLINKGNSKKLFFLKLYIT